MKDSGAATVRTNVIASMTACVTNLMATAGVPRAILAFDANWTAQVIDTDWTAWKSVAVKMVENVITSPANVLVLLDSLVRYALTLAQ